MQKVVVFPTLREEAAFCGVVVDWRAKSTFRSPQCSFYSQGNLDTPQIPRARMGSETIAHEAEDRMGY